MELSPIHSPHTTDSQGYRSIVNQASEHPGQTKLAISSTVSPLMADAIASSNQQEDTGIPTPVPPYAGGAPFSRAQDEEEMVRARIELATRTPWKEFVTHPVALCLLAANFQYVRFLCLCCATEEKYLITVYSRYLVAGLDELHAHVGDAFVLHGRSGF
jgi:hypothetical protein